MRDFEGKTAVITGGASGMGLAMAECFAREGMNIVLADIEKGALREAAARIEELGVSALPVPTDVSSESEMNHLAHATGKRFGAADVLCLNAGVSGGSGPIETLSAKDWRWTIDVNLYGIVHGLQAFLEDMKSRDSGEIVITASVAGLTSFPGSVPYNATKHAAVAIAEGLFSELAEAGSNVHAHCLCPGLVSTNIHASERNRPKELMNAKTSNLSDEEAAAMQSMMQQVFAGAKPAAEVAELVLGAIVDGRFWIQTDEHYRESIRQRHRSIENDTDPPARGNLLTPYG